MYIYNKKVKSSKYYENVEGESIKSSTSLPLLLHSLTTMNGTTNKIHRSKKTIENKNKNGKQEEINNENKNGDEYYYHYPSFYGDDMKPEEATVTGSKTRARTNGPESNLKKTASELIVEYNKQFLDKNVPTFFFIIFTISQSL